MFQAVFRHSDVLMLPIVALVLFALAFVAVSVRAMKKNARPVIGPDATDAS